MKSQNQNDNVTIRDMAVTSEDSNKSLPGNEYAHIHIVKSIKKSVPKMQNSNSNAPICALYETLFSLIFSYFMLSN